MKKAILLFIVLVSFESCDKQLKCLDLKNGTFELTSETGTTIIERKGDTQIEKKDGLNYYSDVEWINDCSYRLTNHRNQNGELEKAELNSVYTIEILEVMKNSIRIKTSANYSENILERKLRIIKIE